MEPKTQAEVNLANLQEALTVLERIVDLRPNEDDVIREAGAELRGLLKQWKAEHDRWNPSE